MRVISKRPLVEFYRVVPAAKEAMDDWYDVAERSSWSNFAAVKSTFPQTDLISSKKHGSVLVFDVRGNRYRIVCTAHFNRQTLFVRFAGTHQDYDKLDMESL